MSQVVYRIFPDRVRCYLEWVASARDEILAAAPVDGEGRFLDDGTWSSNQDLFGIPITVFNVDTRSLGALESDLSVAIGDVVAAAAIKLADERWYITHLTVTRIARLIDQLNAIRSRVLAVVSGLDIDTPQDIAGIVDGAAVIPATFDDFDAESWPHPELMCALRGLADLNYQAHRAEGHGKSWEPAFTIAREGDQWTVTFRSYQFADTSRSDDDYVFTGSWDALTDKLRGITAYFARKYEVPRVGGELEDSHPLARLSAFELANLPAGVQLHLSPGRLFLTGGPESLRPLLERFDAGLDTAELIEFARYAVAVAPEHSSLGRVIGWTGEEPFEDEEC